MKYGNYSTFDCPSADTKEEQEKRIKICYDWLDKQLDAIPGCYVIQKINHHDFGFYPSFEIFMPTKYELIDDYDDEEEDIELLKEKDKCIQELNKIETKYSKKFKEWL